jgi:hypothetical protein
VEHFRVAIRAKREQSIDVERRFGNAHLAAHLVDARSQFGLLKRECDLVFGELASLHDMLLALLWPLSCRLLYF